MYLAEELMAKGERDRCREVLDYAEEMLPGYNIPYDYTAASMAQMYFSLGTEEDLEKGNQMMRTVADKCVDYLTWGDSLNKSQRKSVQNTLNQQLGIFSYVLQTCERYHQKEILDEYYPIYSNYAKRQ